MMYKNLCIIIISAFTLLSCGYSPLHSQSSNLNFAISNFEIEGEREINNLIKKKLERYFNNQSLKKFEINLVTDFSKITLVKDRKGNSTDIKLIVDINLTYSKVTEEDIDEAKSISYSESFTIKKDENNYDQKNYEKIMKKEMTHLIVDKIIFELSKK